MLKAFLFNQIPLSTGAYHAQRKAALALIALVLLSTVGCGKRKPPLPPKERVAQRVEVTGFQRGSNVILTWKMPARNADAGSLLNIARADVYRLTEPVSAPQNLSEEEFANRSTLVAAIPLRDSDFALSTMSYTDSLQFAGQAARLRYAVRFVNASGQKAAFSNFYLIEPANRIAGSPTSLAAQLSQENVKLTWTAPAANVDGSVPVNVLGFNAYRSGSIKDPAKLLNKTPISDSEYSDRSFEFGKTYFYFVRTVSLGTDGQPVESTESNIVEIRPTDVFAPSAPAAITLAATPTTISIFFAINPETDVAGYRIYRSTDPALPKPEWQLLTKELLKTNTFQDTDIRTGTVYYYYITAVDNAGNVSAPSDVVSEKAP
jgi:predicted phage tail protein